jgi:curved DNA-binding protein CbpA
MIDYYEILQVSPRAEPEIIEAAYKRLALKYHPDTNQTASATERMKWINQAYALLSDPVQRAQYDAARRAYRATPRPPPPSANPQSTSAVSPTAPPSPPSAHPFSLLGFIADWVYLDEFAERAFYLRSPNQRSAHSI